MDFGIGYVRIWPKLVFLGLNRYAILTIFGIKLAASNRVLWDLGLYCKDRLLASLRSKSGSRDLGPKTSDPCIVSKIGNSLPRRHAHFQRRKMPKISISECL